MPDLYTWSKPNFWGSIYILSLLDKVMLKYKTFDPIGYDAAAIIFSSIKRIRTKEKIARCEKLGWNMGKIPNFSALAMTEIH